MAGRVLLNRHFIYIQEQQQAFLHVHKQYCVNRANIKLLHYFPFYQYYTFLLNNYLFENNQTKTTQIIC